MPTLREKDAAAAATQTAINGLTMVAAIREAILAAADFEHAAYSQYAGYWAGAEWQLGFVKRAVKTKRGVAFRTGDVVLYKAPTAADIAAGIGDPGFVTAYSVRNTMNTSVAAGDIEPLAVGPEMVRAGGGLVWMVS